MSILFKSVLFIEFLFQSYCQYIYFSAVMERKKSADFTLVFFLTVSCIEFIIYETVYIPIVNLIVLPTLSFIVCLMCYKSHIGFKLLHSAMMSGIFILSEMIALPFVNYAMNDDYIQTHSNESELILSTFSKILTFAVCMLIKQIAEKEIIKTNSIYLFVVPIFTLVILHSFVILSSNVKESFDYNIMVLIISISLIVINFIVFLVHESYVKKAKENENLRLIEQEKQLVYEHYKVLSENYKNTRILVHDFKSHVNVLRSIAEEGETKEILKYINSLSSQEYFIGSKLITGNKILDIVLYQFSKKCKEKNIFFEVVPNKINFTFVDESDLCGMMTNLLNNAVEAAEKSTDKKIQIYFYKKTDKEMYFIDIINSCDKQPVIENGLPVTLKNNKKLHGIGVKSIQKTTKKYCGDIAYKYDMEAHVFIVHINICDNYGSKKT